MQTPLFALREIPKKCFYLGVSRGMWGREMPSVAIQDLWLTDQATPDIRRAVARARDPRAVAVPAGVATDRYGQGRRWRCTWRIPRPGGGYRQQTRSFDDRREAENFAAEQEAQLRRGVVRDIHAGERWVRDVADMWIASKPNLGGATKKRYKREIRVWVLPRWGESRLQDVTTPALQGWVEELAAGEAPHEYSKHGRGARAAGPLSARSIRNIVSVVMGGIIEYAYQSGWIARNPMGRVTLPAIHDAVDADDRIYLSHADVDKLAEAVATARSAARKGRRGPSWSDMDKRTDWLIVMMLAYTGMRVGELMALQCRDVDLDARRIRVRQTWTVEDGHNVVGPPKNRKPRTIAVPGMLVEDIRARMAGPDDYLIRAPRGGPWEVNNWRGRVWAPAIEALKWTDRGVTIHTLRHTYASWAIAAGVDVKTLQAQLGHSSAMITLDTYASLWPDRLGQIAETIADARMHGSEDDDADTPEDADDQKTGE